MTYIEYFFCVESLAVLLVVIVAYLLRFLHKRATKRETKKLCLLRNILLDIQVKPNVNILNSIPKKLHQIDLLIPLINELNQKKLSENWCLVRNDLIRLIAFPLALKAMNKKSLRAKSLAIQVFDLCPNDVGQENIEILLGDKTPLIRIFATDIAIKAGYKSMLRDYIVREQDPVLRAIYANLLATSNGEL